MLPCCSCAVSVPRCSSGLGAVFCACLLVALSALPTKDYENRAKWSELAVHRWGMYLKTQEAIDRNAGVLKALGSVDPSML